MLSAKSELRGIISTFDEQRAEEALALLHLLLGAQDPETRRAALAFIHEQVPEFLGEDGPSPRLMR